MLDLQVIVFDLLFDLQVRISVVLFSKKYNSLFLTTTERWAEFFKNDVSSQSK